MQTSFLKITEDTPIKEVARIIFSTNISSLPIVKGNKLVGIVSEVDVLSDMYPDIQKLLKDKSDSVKDAEASLHKIANLPVSKIMVKNVVTVSENASITHAQGIMIENQFRMVPVLGDDKKLVGVITHGDIFRHLIKEEVPKMELEHYAGFVSSNYDKMVDWKKRFEYEFPALFRIFSRHNVHRVLDLGVWTGEYSLGLIKEGLEVVGVDHNPSMIKIANDKKKKISNDLQKRISFHLSDFSNLAEVVDGEVDAVISMGSSFPYIPYDLEKTLLGAKKVLRKEDGVIFLQILNMEKVLTKQRRLLSFSIQKTKGEKGSEQMFLEYYDKKDNNIIEHHVVVFDYDGKSWIYKGMSSVPVKNVKKEDVEKILKNLSFKNISFSGNQGEYQGEYGQISLIKPFDQKNSDWMNVFATT